MNSKRFNFWFAVVLFVLWVSCGFFLVRWGLFLFWTVQTYRAYKDWKNSTLDEFKDYTGYNYVLSLISNK